VRVGRFAQDMATVSLATFLVLLVVLFYAISSPFTKVEESFALQATHDILSYGMNVSQVLDPVVSDS